MHLNLQKEEFSFAFVSSVAAVAGLKIVRTKIDDDSVDATIERSGGAAPRLDLQLKCTAEAIPSTGDLFFDLERKNFDDLRRATAVPRLLVVLFVPSDCSDWLTIPTPPSEIMLRRHAWWASLIELPDSPNRTQVRIPIPRDNLLTPESLTAHLDAIEAEFTAS